MKRKGLVMILTALFIVSALFLAGNQARAEESLGVDSLKLSAGSVGGSWYPLAGAMADLLNKTFEGDPAAGIPGGSVSNPGIIAKGQAEIGFSYSSYLAAAAEGIDPYKEKVTNLKGIMKILPMYVQVLVEKEQPFNSLDEFFEMKPSIKLCPLKPGVGDFWVAQKIFEFYGHKLEDVKDWGGSLQFVGSSEAVNLWRDRHINMYTRQGGAPTSDVYEMIVSVPAKILPITGELKDTLIDKFGMSPQVVPAGTYPGIEEDVETVGMSAVLFCREDLPEDVVYKFTRTMLQNMDHLASVYKVLGTLDPTTLWKNLGAEQHPGARKAFEELGYLQ
ncbi:MAG: TAXI family TRAP transporter solute-binding subunit [Synergistales bacterium]|nr:TAXI family TRAP transporter solute-binding subunit [Synergistales bacterium]